MNAIRLKTEYLKNPIGIAIVKPRLFWNCADGENHFAIAPRPGGNFTHAG